MMQSELTLRPMTASELPQVLALENACFPDPWTEGIFRASLENPMEFWLVALRDGQVLGYAGLQSVLDEGYLDNIAVSPLARRQGVATALLREIEAEARRRKLSFLSLEVRAGNAPAIALYARMGFQTLGVRPGYYLSPREDARIMTKYYTADREETEI